MPQRVAEPTRLDGPCGIRRQHEALGPREFGGGGGFAHDGGGGVVGQARSRRGGTQSPDGRQIRQRQRVGKATVFVAGLASEVPTEFRSRARSHGAVLLRRTLGAPRSAGAVSSKGISGRHPQAAWRRSNDRTIAGTRRVGRVGEARSARCRMRAKLRLSPRSVNGLRLRRHCRRHPARGSGRRRAQWRRLRPHVDVVANDRSVPNTSIGCRSRTARIKRAITPPACRATGKGRTDWTP